MKFNIQTKLLVYILSVTFVIYLLAFSIIIYNINRDTINYSVTQTDYIAKKSAQYFEEILNKDVEIMRTIKNTFYDFNKMPEKQREKLRDDILSRLITENQQFLSIASVWEISALDSSYNKPYGRYRYLYFLQSGKIVIQTNLLNTEGDDFAGLYYKIKTQKKDIITREYYDNYTGEEVLMSSIAIPIVKNNEFQGLIIADIALERFNSLVKEIKPIKNSNAFLVTNNGHFVAYHNEKYITKSINSVFKKEEKEYQILDKIKTGEPISYFYTDSLGKDFYVTYQPLDIGGFNTPWSFGLAVPLTIIKQQANKLVLISLIVGILGLIIITILIWFIARTISKPLISATKSLTNLSVGNIYEGQKIEIRSKDEIGQITNSLNQLIDGLLRTADFAKNIGEGNLDTKFTLLGSKDVLGNSLLEMRKSLKIANIVDKKRKQEEEIQTWITYGETKFAEILREYNENLLDLSYQIISNLVKYLEAVQGGLFIINDDNKDNVFIELIASYAYDRKKMLNKKIPLGIGLIGRAIQESETIYMTDVPNDYVNVTSGLGENNPNTILIVPLKFNEVIYAVVELASFKEFKPHSRRFIERIGVSIASTIGSVRTKEKTDKLVNELQTQSAELSAQDEEMRQNMEEMRTTQEEAFRKVDKQEGIIDAINQIYLVVEYDLEGRIININQKFLDLLGKTYNEMLGKYQGSFLVDSDKQTGMDEFWQDILNGKIKHLTQKVIIANEKYWFSEVYTLIYDELGKPEKVFNIAVDITKSMDKNQ